jgi:hypothetical protein
MKKILPLSIAVSSTIIILSCIILFHFLVIAGLIPYTIVWGGNIADKSQLYTMEAVSISINAIMLFVVLAYCGAIKLTINRKIIYGAIWLMFGLFLLNTFGNLMAKNALETYIFTPLTLILSICCLRMATSKNRQQQLS